MTEDKMRVADLIIKALLVAAFIGAAFETMRLRWAVEKANVHAARANENSAENNRILRERDFDRLYGEHAQHHREHAELRELLCSLPELRGRCPGR